MGKDIAAEDNENFASGDIIAGISEGYRFLEIYKAIHPLITPDGILVDMGHGKNLQFPVRLAQTIAKHFPKKEIVYYDSSNPEVVRGWLDSFTNKAKRTVKKKSVDLAVKAMQIAGEIPDVIRWVDSPKEYLGRANEVCQFFTGHHFENPAEAVKEAYNILKPEGIAIIIDYDLKRMIHGMDREEAREYVTSRFTTASESKVKETEPDWFEAHTKWGLADCVRDMSEAGFNVIDREVYDDKIFFCAGRKK